MIDIVPVIQTPRLVLRAPTEADVDNVQAAKLEVWPEQKK